MRKSSDKREVIRLVGKGRAEEESWNVLTRLIRKLPVDEFASPLETTELISTPLDNYELQMKGDVRSVSKSLSVVATRVSWFVGAMLLALLLAWLLIEISIIRRISLLTKRAAELSRTMKGAGELDQLDVSDLRSPDELGVLASGLRSLASRERDVERRNNSDRTETNVACGGPRDHVALAEFDGTSSDRWDQSHRYINRMQQTIKVLYGHATPVKLFNQRFCKLVVDLNLFLKHVAENAPHTVFQQLNISRRWVIVVKADEYSLEDVVTHILKNADRYRPEGSAIRIYVELAEQQLQCIFTIRDQTSRQTCLIRFLNMVCPTSWIQARRASRPRIVCCANLYGENGRHYCCTQLR